MHSYVVEVARGIAFHNIVTSIMEEYKVDVPAAMEWLDNFGRYRVDTFLNGIKQLPSWGPGVDANVQKFIKNIGYAVRGADAWSYESEKYWGKKGMEIQRTRLVALFLGVKEIQEGLVSKEELKAVIL